jgi:hypothetical protein
VAVYLYCSKWARLNTFTASNAAFVFNHYCAIVILFNRIRVTDLNTPRALTVMARDKMQLAIALFDRKPRERARILTDSYVNIA